MTFNDACEHIRETANSYGFEVTQDRYSRLPFIRSEELNFFLLEKHDYHHAAREVTTHIQASASVRRMGGNPTVEELLNTADEIRRGAELVRKLQEMSLSFTETF